MGTQDGSKKDTKIEDARPAVEDAGLAECAVEDVGLAVEVTGRTVEDAGFATAPIVQWPPPFKKHRGSAVPWRRSNAAIGAAAPYKLCL